MIIDSPSLQNFQYSGEIDDYLLKMPERKASGHAAFGMYNFSKKNEATESSETSSDDKLDEIKIKNVSTDTSLVKD